MNALPQDDNGGDGAIAALLEDLPRAGAGEILSVAPDTIDPNPHQPRRSFSPEALEELTRSIRQHGILQPLVVRGGSARGRYELVCGERRLRAAQVLGMPAVPCVVVEVPDDRLLEIALVENIQRQDLGPLEVARAYDALMKRFGYSHVDLARKLAVGRASVTNALRLLELPEDIQADVAKRTLSAGHARAIAALPGAGAQRTLAERVARESLTVRETEAAAAKLKERSRAPGGRKKQRPEYLEEIESRMRRRLGTKVTIRQSGAHSGTIVIDFYGEDDFERLLDLLG
jgi:ParB family chromosome partitioning protein